MTDPLSSAAEALRSIPSLKMKSLKQRREIARVVLDHAAPDPRIAAVLAVIESGYPGVGKADKCEHGRYGFEDCIACYDEALLAALQPKPAASRPTSIADLGKDDGDGPLPVYPTKI